MCAITSFLVYVMLGAILAWLQHRHHDKEYHHDNASSREHWAMCGVHTAG